MKTLPNVTSSRKRLHFAAFISLLLPLAIHSTGFAQTVTATPDSVDVTKLDPVLVAPQASVVLSQGGVEKYKKETDADGKYRIDSVAVGDYVVEGSLASYSPSDKANLKVNLWR